MSSTDRIPVLDFADESWRSRFIRSSEASTATERKQLAERAAAGRLIRVRRGVYMLPPAASRPEDRMLERVRAYHLTDPSAVFSHASAAALWRLPLLDESAPAVSILTSATAGGFARAGLIAHRESAPAARVTIEGIPVTSIGRTAVDVARSESPLSAVAVVDAALRGIRSSSGRLYRADRGAMLDTLDMFASNRGIATARWAIEFADGRAERPGESISRVQIHRIGFAPPELQAVFVDDEGLMEADFFWPEYGVVGEFDGMGKYLMRNADPLLSAVDAVMAEKRREDRLRRQPRVRTVVRWDWRVAHDRNSLRRLLYDAGVR